MKYKQQLRSNEWKLKRNEILERDNYCCRECSSKEFLQIHHIKYIYGRNAWDYPNYLLITYCGNCHRYLHSKEKIIVLKDKIKNKTHKTNKIKVKKTKKTINKDLLKGFSKKDKLLQKKYDDFKKKKKDYDKQIKINIECQ